MYDLPKKVSWNEEEITTFKETLNSASCKEEVEKLLNKSEGATAEEISTLLLKVGKIELRPNLTCSKKSGRQRRSLRKDQPWFDEECKQIKQEIASCGKTLRSAPHATSVREKIYIMKKKLRNLTRKKKLAFQTMTIEEMCKDMSNGEHKKYWKQLRKLETAKDEIRVST